MQTEMIKLEELTLDPSNARKHSDKNLEAIKQSLERFGQQKPIVIDENNVVRAGNGTIEAARALDWEEVSAVRSNLVGPEMTAYAIADNRTAELASWDNDVLKATLTSLRDMPDSDEVIEAMGFEPSDVASILGERGSDLNADLAGVELSDSVTEQMDAWQQSGLRSLVFPFSMEQYEEVVETLKEWREVFGVESNSDLLLEMTRNEEIAEVMGNLVVLPDEQS